MTTTAVRRFLTSLLVLLSAAVWCASAQGQAAPRDAAPAVVLDTLSVWRIHETLKPPVIQLDDGPSGKRPVTSTYQWLDRETAAAPADWTKPEFPDATWLRGGARATSRTPYVANLCLRARFEVTDPAQVKDLKLTVVYSGGAIVYLNGQELARGNVAKRVQGSGFRVQSPTVATVPGAAGERPEPRTLNPEPSYRAKYESNNFRSNTDSLDRFQRILLCKLQV